MAHPAAERLQIELAIRIVGGDDGDAVRAFRRGLHVPHDRVSSLGARERIVDCDVRAPAAEFLDHRPRGRVPRVVRVLPVRETEDRDTGSLDLPTGSAECFYDAPGHSLRL